MFYQEVKGSDKVAIICGRYFTTEKYATEEGLDASKWTVTNFSLEGFKPIYNKPIFVKKFQMSEDNPNIFVEAFYPARSFGRGDGDALEYIYITKEELDNYLKEAKEI